MQDWSSQTLTPRHTLVRVIALLLAGSILLVVLGWAAAWALGSAWGPLQVGENLRALPAQAAPLLWSAPSADSGPETNLHGLDPGGADTKMYVPVVLK